MVVVFIQGSCQRCRTSTNAADIDAGAVAAAQIGIFTVSPAGSPGVADLCAAVIAGKAPAHITIPVVAVSADGNRCTAAVAGEVYAGGGGSQYGRTAADVDFTAGTVAVNIGSGDSSPAVRNSSDKTGGAYPGNSGIRRSPRHRHIAGDGVQLSCIAYARECVAGIAEIEASGVLHGNDTGSLCAAGNRGGNGSGTGSPACNKAVGIDVCNIRVVAAPSHSGTCRINCGSQLHAPVHRDGGCGLVKRDALCGIRIFRTALAASGGSAVCAEIVGLYLCIAAYIAYFSMLLAVLVIGISSIAMTSGSNFFGFNLLTNTTRLCAFAFFRAGGVLVHFCLPGVVNHSNCLSTCCLALAASAAF